MCEEQEGCQRLELSFARFILMPVALSCSTVLNFRGRFSEFGDAGEEAG